MKKVVSLHAFSHTKQLTFTAVFAALCLIGTIVIAIPLPIGYFNVGDVFVLLAGWCLGPLYGPIAAGVGSALADVVSGYPLYVPATFFIKAADALIAYTVCAFLKKCVRKDGLDFLPRALSAILGEIVMVAGYFLYEGILYDFTAAVGGLLGNGMQGLFCLTVATALISALYPVKAVRQLFPDLKK